MERFVERGVKWFNRVILVTGTPGVGKTAASTSLASKLNAVHIDLSKLVQRERLVIGVDKVRGTLIADVDRVSKRVKEIIRSFNRDIIIDGHYAVNVVPAKDVFLVFVLRRDPDELKRRMQDRRFRGQKIWENLSAEILDVCLWEAVKTCGPNKVCEVNVTEKSIVEVVEDMISVLERKKRKCRVGIVDWLGKLETEGRLGDFLKDF